MKIVYKCRECDEPLASNAGLVQHICYKHGIQPKEYYDRYIRQPNEGICPICGKETAFIKMSVGYNKFCSKICRDKYLCQETDEELSFHCEICGYNIVAHSKKRFYPKIQNHIKTHNINTQQYYDKFLKKPGEGFCDVCGKPVIFYSLFRGYAKHCQGACTATSKVIEAFKQEKELKQQLKEEKENYEKNYNNFVQELKDRVEEFSWDGEKNTWLGGTKPKIIDTKENMITDNSVSYIDGQEYNAQMQTIVENNLTDIDNSSDLQQFWL